MKKIINLNVIGSLLLLWSFTVILIYSTNHLILNVAFYNRSGDPLSGFSEGEQEIYGAIQKWIYISATAYLLVKLIIVSLILYVGLFLAGHTVSFSRIFKVTIYAEYIFILAAILKMAWFQHVYPHGNLANWHQTYVLSALSLVGTAPPDWYYALQTLNVFEVVYWFLLALGISRLVPLGFDRSLRLVVMSYLPLLFIWVATITFCTLVMFPVTG
ncbi:MAG: hypothetical protein ACHQHN_13805 [Sphingobacteriales bacterium]